MNLLSRLRSIRAFNMKTVIQVLLEHIITKEEV